VNPRKIYDLPLPGGGVLRLGERTLVMGIVNVTPDSFADAGLCLDPAAAEAAALEMEARGADLIDVGGESTRPGAGAVSADEELARILPVLRRLSGRVRVPLSIDTYKAVVAQAAIDAGASIVNDISGLGYDPALGAVVARSGAGLVLMHMRGRPREMYQEARYASVTGEVARELAVSLETALAAGVSRDRVIVDPGLGFAKRAGHSYEVLAGLADLAALDRPLLVGASRKSFLTAAAGDRAPDERDWATAAAVTAAVLLGAHIVRVHAVAEMIQVVRVADRIRTATTGAGD
jgi:dihydropteroate synthase